MSSKAGPIKLPFLENIRKGIQNNLRRSLVDLNPRKETRTISRISMEEIKCKLIHILTTNRQIQKGICVKLMDKGASVFMRGMG